MPPRLTSQRATVIVGLLIGVIAVALALVGIARMRESAAAMRCQNNLRQLGLALHCYQDANGKLPPLLDQGVGAVTGRGLQSVFALLTPYTESMTLTFREGLPAERYHGHSSVGFPIRDKMGETYTQHGGKANHPLGFFLCPADTTANGLRDIPMTLPDGTVGYYATGNYAANRALPWGAKLPESALPESANLVVFGERPQVCRTAGGEEVFNLWGLGFESPHAPVFTATAFQWVRPGVPCDPRVPGTPHRGGMQAAMADASVRVFSHDTDPAVFWAACRPGTATDRP